MHCFYPCMYEIHTPFYAYFSIAFLSFLSIILDSISLESCFLYCKDYVFWLSINVCIFLNYFSSIFVTRWVNTKIIASIISGCGQEPSWLLHSYKARNKEMKFPFCSVVLKRSHFGAIGLNSTNLLYWVLYGY